MKKSIALFALLVFAATALFSHSGGLDSNGGHWDRKSGTYHYHRSPSNTPTTVAPTTTTTTPSNTQKKEIIVYVTKTGSKYHVAGCRYLAQSMISLNLSFAKQNGYTPCSVCNPPK
ncbi:hypothetical protein SDC9_11669 [bioreactor metagenome]|uniref:YHYH domain-containing protein n=1 Tax=bioreactor metagenome TaxID=1076179 RepID=A0A644TJW5_9ZZZZ